MTRISDNAVLINTLRQRLRIQIDQQEKLRWNAPAYLQLEIDDARAQIAVLKARIRAERGVVTDMAIDFAPGDVPAAPPDDRAAALREKLQAVRALLGEIDQLI